MVGFCNAEVNPLGPTHAKVEPDTVEVPVRLRVRPLHNGVPALLEAVATGVWLTMTVVVAVPEHPSLVTVNVYVPLAAVVTLAMVGFCKAEVKLLGPTHANVEPVTVDEPVRLSVKPLQIPEPALLEAVAEGV